MRVALLSDTHVGPGKVDTVISELGPKLEGVDAILHAGDIVTLELVDALSRLAPCQAVAGNMDGPEVHARLPEQTVVELGDKRIGLIHGWGSSSDLPERVLDRFPGPEAGTPVDVIVFGHTHLALVERHGAVLLVNPGSPTDNYFAPYRSMAILEIGSTVQANIIRL